MWQKIWTSVILATEDSEVAKKKFLSRTARYSGLLNILEFVDYNEFNAHPKDLLPSVLEDANTWIGFNVSRENVVGLADIALQVSVYVVGEYSEWVSECV